MLYRAKVDSKVRRLSNLSLGKSCKMAGQVSDD
jgi:hypothetical protein